MSIVGTWKVTVSTPMGEQESTIVINADGTGVTRSRLGTTEFDGATIDGDSATFAVTIDVMGQKTTLNATAKATGDEISGTYESQMGSSPFSGSREP